MLEYPIAVFRLLIQNVIEPMADVFNIHSQAIRLSMQMNIERWKTVAKTVGMVEEIDKYENDTQLSSKMQQDLLITSIH